MEKKMTDEKTGYLVCDLETFDLAKIKCLQSCRSRCDKLIVGVPSDELVVRMTDAQPQQSFEKKKELLLLLKAVDEVVSVDVDNITKADSYEQLHYDICFYGSEYGRYFQEDRKFLQDRGVEMVPLLPATLGGPNSLRMALENGAPGKKVILFGTGAYFDSYMKQYSSKYMPAYAVDNSCEKWGTKKDGVEIKSPSALMDEDPQKVFIILCCKNYGAVLEQLLEMKAFNYRPMRADDMTGVFDEYAVTWRDDMAYVNRAHSLLKILMKEFDAVCKKYHLRYYVISGSLIGIVRHQALIPWDDDIDVAMPRKDYEILKQKANEIWKDNDFLFLEYDQIGEDVFYDFMTRFVYLKEEIATGIFRKASDKAREDIKNRMIIDIYVLDNTVGGWKHKLITTMIKGVYVLGMGHRGYVDYADYGRLSRVSLQVLRMVNGIGRMIPLKVLFAMYEKLRTYADKKETEYYFESDGVIHYMPYLYEKKLYGDGTRLKMWDMDVMVPADYDGLLKAKGYGDYMQFPPVNCRKPSHSPKTCGVIW